MDRVRLQYTKASARSFVILDVEFLVFATCTETAEVIAS